MQSRPPSVACVCLINGPRSIVNEIEKKPGLEYVLCRPESLLGLCPYDVISQYSRAPRDTVVAFRLTEVLN